jgi:HPt (histidine-containing phosphotransfer) domain-containing protein
VTGDPPNVAVIPPEVADIAEEYLAKRRADIVRYREALGRGDFDAIRCLAHKMKGTGTGYGFSPLTEIGAALEKASAARDLTALEAGIESLSRYIGSVVLEYSK